MIIAKKAWEYSHRFRKIEFYNRILKIHNENIIYAVLFRNKTLKTLCYEDIINKLTGVKIGKQNFVIV